MAMLSSLTEKLDRIAAHPAVALACRLVIGGSLLYASFHKVLHPHVFARVLRAYELLPAVLIGPLSYVMPWGEVVIGVCLVLGIFTRVIALAAAGLFAVFSTAVTWAVAHALHISCGCFGSEPGAEPVSWATVARSLFFLLLSLLVWNTDKGALALDFFLKKRRLA